MKANYLKLFFVIMLCMSVGSAGAQGLKSALVKAKNAVGDVGIKVTGDKNASNKSKSIVAKPIALDVKNSVSEIRSLTGLSEDLFEKKVKGLGFVKTTDETGLLGGETVYKSKSKDFSISVKMGTRNGELLTFEVTRNNYKKKAVLSAMKLNFLELGKQCLDLKAEFKYAKVDERGKILGGVGAKNLANRSSKFLPALDNMINSKKEFFVTDIYEETDYDYRIIFYNINADGSALMQITVVDKTVESQEG